MEEASPRTLDFSFKRRVRLSKEIVMGDSPNRACMF